MKKNKQNEEQQAVRRLCKAVDGPAMTMMTQAIPTEEVVTVTVCNYLLLILCKRKAKR